MSDTGELDWTGIKEKAVIGACFAVAVVAWMVYARPDAEAPSARGFNLGSSSEIPSGAPGRPFAARPKTGLDMVSAQIGAGPPGVTSGIYRDAGAGQPASIGPTAAASPAAADAPTPPAGPAPTGNAPAKPPAPNAADEAKDLASAGIPTDPKGLSNLGAKEGLLSALAAKLLDHPKILAAVMNNKMVVDAFMARGRVKENCESGGALKTYLSDSGSGGMTKVFPVIQQALGRPATSSALVSALAGTEMVKRLSSCPSLTALSNDSSAIVSIAVSNPKALGLLMDPRGAAALASNPQAAGLLAGLQSKMGGAK